MRKKLLILAAVGVVGAGVAGATAFAARDAHQVHGALRSEVLAGPACTSPIGLCTAGRLTGVINGDFVFTATRLEPSDTPGIFFYTGQIVVKTSRGEIRCQDAGAFGATPPGPVADICTITGGTDRWAGATGHIRIHGTFTFADGGNSKFEGEVIVP